MIQISLLLSRIENNFAHKVNFSNEIICFIQCWIFTLKNIRIIERKLLYLWKTKIRLIEELEEHENHKK